MMQLLKNLAKGLIPGCYLLYKGKSRNREVALTFDDGPHPLYTQTILKTLEKNNVRAAFFFTGSMAERHPELVRAIIDNGHDIGNHSFSHGHIKKMNYKELSGEIQRTNKLIQDIAGVPPKFYRPPYGELSIGLLRYVFFKKIKIVLWSFDSHDSKLTTTQELENYIKQSEIQPGEIMLFHEDYEHTIEALPDIITDLKSRGFTFSTVSQLLEQKYL